MNRPKGDIDGLFQSFGSSADRYRDLSREADAEDAQRRWPMLGEIAPEADATPERVGSVSQRDWAEVLRGEGEDEPLAAPAPNPASERLKGGLSHLLKRAPTAPSTPVAPPPEALRPEAPARRALAPEASRTVMPPPPAPHRVRRSEPDDAAPRRTGLFGSRKDADASRSGDRLSDVFSRLDGGGRPKGLFDRGRKSKR